MATPIDGAGYTDPGSGQYIPGSFADQLDLPGPSATPDSAAAQAAYRAIGKEHIKTMQYQKNIGRAHQGINALQALLANKHLSKSQRAKYQGALAKQQSYLKQQVSLRQASVKQYGVLQNKYYEASGQYDKLLTGANRDAFAALKALFNGYGLGSLAGKIYEYAKQGYGADTISLLLQDTKEYKTRFAANEQRVKNGLPVLSPAEYLSTEQAYRQIMADSGLPKGFYDNPADFTNWISGDVSPTEVKGRVDLASANLMQSNPATIQALKSMYGVDQSYITAYFLDRNKALPLLQKQAQAAQFGGEALKRGLTTNTQDLEDFVTAGLSLGQVSSGFQAVAEALPNIQAIANRYGEKPFSQQELERDIIGGQATALGETRRKRLASQERALFSGFGGATAQGLSTSFQPS